VSYGRTLSGATGCRTLQQHQRRGHQHGCARGRHSVSVDRCYSGGDGDQRIELSCPPTHRYLFTPEKHDKSQITTRHDKSQITTRHEIYGMHDVHCGLKCCFHRFFSNNKNII